MTTDPHLRVDLAADMRYRAGMAPADDNQSHGEQDLAIARAVAAERQRALDIGKAAALAGREDLAPDLISSGQPLGDCLRTLAKARRTARGPGRS